jgi:sugar lactone lactonase YvrE
VEELESTRLVADLRFPEAPRWHDGALWYSDMVANLVARIDTSGAVETVAELDDRPGGIGFHPKRGLLIAGMFTAGLYTVSAGRAELWLDLTGISGGHLDDMLVLPDGTSYIGAVGAMGIGQQRTAGQMLRVTPDGVATSEGGGLAFPNGADLSADGRSLIVAETFANRVLAYPIDDGGGLGEPRVFADLPGRHPDGLWVDAEGAAWIGCFRESEFIRVEDGGRITHRIGSGERWATGVTLGGPDGDTLYLCSSLTDTAGYFAGTSVGQIDIATAPVPAPAR